MSTDLTAQNLWIELVQQVKLDPHNVIVQNLDRMISLIETSLEQTENVGFHWMISQHVLTLMGQFAESSTP